METVNTDINSVINQARYFIRTYDEIDNLYETITRADTYIGCIEKINFEANSNKEEVKHLQTLKDDLISIRECAEKALDDELLMDDSKLLMNRPTALLVNPTEIDSQEQVEDCEQNEEDDEADFFEKKMFCKVPKTINSVELSYMLKETTDKGNDFLKTSIPYSSKLFSHEKLLDIVTQKKKIFEDFKIRYLNRNDTLTVNHNVQPGVELVELLENVQELKLQNIEKIALERGIKNETIPLAQFLNNKNLIPDDSSTLDWMFRLDGEVVKKAKLILTDADFPRDDEISDPIIQVALATGLTDFKGGYATAFCHEDDISGRYILCKRYKEYEEYLPLTSLNVIFAGKLEYIVKLERSVVTHLGCLGLGCNKNKDKTQGKLMKNHRTRKGFGIIYLASFSSPDPYHLFKRRMSPIFPTNPIAMIMFSELSFTNLRQISLCSPCGKVALVNPSEHIRFHTNQFSLVDHFRFDRTHKSHEEMVISLVSKYKKRSNISNIIPHCQRQKTLYYDFYLLTLIVNFFGFINGSISFNCVEKNDFDNAKLVENVVFSLGSFGSRSTSVANLPTVNNGNRFFLNYFLSQEFLHVLKQTLKYFEQ